MNDTLDFSALDPSFLADERGVTDATLAESHVTRRLALAYQWPEFCLLTQVYHRFHNSFNGTRIADAVAVRMWQGNRRRWIGFEVKTNRGDWLKELKQPEKSDIKRFCTEWWVAASPGVVKPEELPDGWGWWEIGAKSAKRRRNPKQYEQELNAEFAVSLVRRAYEAYPYVNHRAVELREEIAKQILAGGPDSYRLPIPWDMAQTVDAQAAEIKRLETSLRREQTRGFNLETDRLNHREVIRTCFHEGRPPTRDQCKALGFMDYELRKNDLHTGEPAGN